MDQPDPRLAGLLLNQDAHATGSERAVAPFKILSARLALREAQLNFSQDLCISSLLMLSVTSVVGEVSTVKNRVREQLSSGIGFLVRQGRENSASFDVPLDTDRGEAPDPPRDCPVGIPAQRDHPPKQIGLQALHVRALDREPQDRAQLPSCLTHEGHVGGGAPCLADRVQRSLESFPVALDD